MIYHYTECGLDNVYLENGFKHHSTAYGKGVSFQDLDGLHKAIGRWITDMPAAINGAELRFLRLEMDLTQRDLGGILGQKEQVIGRWEKAKTKGINGSADFLLRALYLEYLNGKGDVRHMVDRLANLNQVERTEIRLCDTNEGWMPQECIDAA